jgi:hypothetical protein
VSSQSTKSVWTYFWLSAEVITASVLIALALFWLAAMIASGNPELQSHMTGSGGILVGLIVVSFGLSRSWKKLQFIEPNSDPTFRKKQKRFSQIAGVFAVLCSAVAIAAGTQVGECDSSVSRFGADVQQNADTMQAIGNARSGATTIDSYIHVYESIEPKVAQARGMISRLRNEIPRCAGFQSRAQRFERMFDNIDQQLALLSQEIAAAKSIDSSPEAERERVWQSKLVPLIDQEASLEKQLQIISQE